MNQQQVRRNARLREALASEYVLGTLRGAARRRFEQWLRNDVVLQRAVAEWQDHLHPIAELAPRAEPSAAVWESIEKRLQLNLAGSARTGRAFWHGLVENLRFWRGMAMASSAVAAILLAVVLNKPPELDMPAASYIATLADNTSQVSVVVIGDATRRQLIVKILAPPAIAADKVLELWAVPEKGVPRSLGLIAASGGVLPLPENAAPQAAPALAISAEPQGGSRDPNGPTGPILFRGAWERI